VCVCVFINLSLYFVCILKCGTDLAGIQVGSPGGRATKARIGDIRKGGGKRKAAASHAKSDGGGATSKRHKKEGEGSISGRDAVKRQASANCTLNRNCALLDNALPLSVLAEPCGMCIFCVLSVMCCGLICVT